MGNEDDLTVEKIKKQKRVEVLSLIFKKYGNPLPITMS
jgi:hypothetical protein